MTRGDHAIVALVVALALVVVPVTIGASVRSPAEAVLTGPAGSNSVPLDVPATYAVEGRGGVVTVRVADGRAWIAHAECPDGLCVRFGAAAPGRPVVCAPNGVAVSVQAGERGALDARTR